MSGKLTKQQLEKIAAYVAGRRGAWDVRTIQRQREIVPGPPRAPEPEEIAALFHAVERLAAHLAVAA